MPGCNELIKSKKTSYKGFKIYTGFALQTQMMFP